MSMSLGRQLGFASTFFDSKTSTWKTFAQADYVARVEGATPYQSAGGRYHTEHGRHEFVAAMAPYFNARLLAVTTGANALQEAREEGLLDINFPSLLEMGLLSFHAVRPFLLRLRDADGEHEKALTGWAISTLQVIDTLFGAYPVGENRLFQVDRHRIPKLHTSPYDPNWQKKIYRFLKPYVEYVTQAAGDDGDVRKEVWNDIERLLFGQFPFTRFYSQLSNYNEARVIIDNVVFVMESVVASVRDRYPDRMVGWGEKYSLDEAYREARELTADQFGVPPHLRFTPSEINAMVQFFKGNKIFNKWHKDFRQAKNQAEAMAVVKATLTFVMENPESEVAVAFRHLASQMENQFVDALLMVLLGFNPFLRSASLLNRIAYLKLVAALELETERGLFLWHHQGKWSPYLGTGAKHQISNTHFTPPRGRKVPLVNNLDLVLVAHTHNNNTSFSGGDIGSILGSSGYLPNLTVPHLLVASLGFSLLLVKTTTEGGQESHVYLSDDLPRMMVEDTRDNLIDDFGIKTIRFEPNDVILNRYLEALESMDRGY